MNKAQKVYVILADPVCSSCMVNAVYLDKERADKWVKKENKAAKFKLYWVERSQLIE